MRPHAARLGCPLLVTAGEIEAAYFREYAHELNDVAGPEGCTCIIVPGANHFYAGCEAFMIDDSRRLAQGKCSLGADDIGIDRFAVFVLAPSDLRLYLFSLKSEIFVARVP